MPRVDPKQIAPADLYGVEEIENNLTMRERLRKRFRPHDTVRVANIDDETLEWQWLSEDDESYVIDESNIKITSRELPGLYRLESGEEDVLEGACAYVMIDVLFKKMSVKKVGVNEHPLDEREIRNFAFDDPQAQEHFIERVFKGKMSPHTMQQAAIESLNRGNGQSKPKVNATSQE